MSAPQTANRATQLRRTSRKVDRVNRVLAAMANGQSLHLQHRDGRPLWSLSDGRSVTADVAAILTCHALVVPADVALFPGLAGQEWRYRL